MTHPGWVCWAAWGAVVLSAWALLVAVRRIRDLKERLSAGHFISRNNAVLARRFATESRMANDAATDMLLAADEAREQAAIADGAAMDYALQVRDLHHANLTLQLQLAAALRHAEQDGRGGPAGDVQTVFAVPE